MMILLALVCAFAVTAVLLWRRRQRRRQMRPGMARTGRKRVVYPRSTCLYCGEENVIHRQDGEPSLKFHACKLRDFELGLRRNAGMPPGPLPESVEPTEPAA